MKLTLQLTTLLILGCCASPVIGEEPIATPPAVSELLERVAAVERRGAPTYGKGIHRIERTLSQGGEGWHVYGTGTGRFQNQANFNSDATVLAWQGEPGGTLLALRGNGASVHHLGLSGIARMVQQGRAGIGLLLTHKTGKHQIGPVTITNCDVAIQAGEKDGDNNCDESDFGMVRIEHCDIGYLSNCSMAMGHTFQHLSCMNVRRPFVIQHGGKLQVDYVFAGHGEVLIDFPPGSTSGSNAASFQFGRVEFDTKSKAMQLATVRQPRRPVDLKFGYVGVAYDHFDGATLVELMAPTSLQIGMLRNAQPGMIQWESLGGQAASVTIHYRGNCQPFDLLAITKSTGPAQVEITGCDWNGRPHSPLRGLVYGTKVNED